MQEIFWHGVVTTTYKSGFSVLPGISGTGPNTFLGQILETCTKANEMIDFSWNGIKKVVKMFMEMGRQNGFIM